jgi:hypothetical protein
MGKLADMKTFCIVLTHFGGTNMPLTFSTAALLACTGGPKKDIVVPALRANDVPSGIAPPTPKSEATTDTPQPQSPPLSQTPVGFLAHDEQSYATCIVAALRMRETERVEMTEAGRRRAQHFSHENFANAWMDSTMSVLPRVQPVMDGKRE